MADGSDTSYWEHAGSIPMLGDDDFINLLQKQIGLTTHERSSTANNYHVELSEIEKASALTSSGRPSTSPPEFTFPSQLDSQYGEGDLSANFSQWTGTQAKEIIEMPRGVNEIAVELWFS